MTGSLTKLTTIITTADADAIEIGDLYRRSRGSLIDSIRYAMACGERLAAKKASLPHGAWLPWLEANADALFDNRRRRHG